MDDQAASPPRHMSGALAVGWAASPRRLSALSLHFRERRLILLLGDLLALNLALGVTLAVRTELVFTRSLLWWYALWFVSLMALWLMVSFGVSLYDVRVVASGLRSLKIACASVLAACVIYSLLPFITPPLPMGRLHLLILPLTATISIVLWRLLYDVALRSPSFDRRAIVIGTGAPALYLAQTIDQISHGHARGESLGYQLIGLIDDAPERRAEQVHGLPVFGGCGDLLAAIEEHRPDEVVVATSRLSEVSDELLRSILAAQEKGTRITTMTMLYEQLTGRIALEQIGPRFDIVLPLSRGSGHRFYLAVRRAAELVACLLGCLALLVVIPFVWLGNRFFSPGPLFFRQQRVGMGGRTFDLLKFRSMIVDAEKETGAVWATEHDPRITSLGRFLRKTRIDELPQFWNILTGDMSLIGPRPERPEFVAQLSERLPFYRVRHAIRPGITGWAQVKYRYASSLDDTLIKLQYDLYYIKHRTLILDLLIVLNTAQIILGLKGR